MASIRNALSRFSPWLTIAAVYLALGLAGRTFLWVKFGLEADVGAARLPYILTAGFINDLGREPVPVRAVRALHPAAAGPLVPVDRQPRDPVRRHRRDHRGPAVPDRGGILLLRRVRRALQHRRVRLPRVSDGGVHRHLGRLPRDEGARRGRVTRLRWPSSSLRNSIKPGFAHVRPLPRAARGVRAVCRGAGPGRRVLSDERAVVLVEPRRERTGAERAQQLFPAARTSDIDYESYYASAKPADNLRLLEAELAADGAPFTQLAQGKMNRRHAARPDGLGKLNVVVVSSESFGAEFSKLHGSKQGLDAELRRLREAGALVREHLCVRHAHRAWP